MQASHGRAICWSNWLDALQSEGTTSCWKQKAQKQCKHHTQHPQSNKCHLCQERILLRCDLFRSGKKIFGADNGAEMYLDGAEMYLDVAEMYLGGAHTR